MYAIYNNITEYHEANAILNQYLGYPDGRGTLRYATDTPTMLTNGKYAMNVRDSLIAVLPADTVYVEAVQYISYEFEELTDLDQLKAWIDAQGWGDKIDKRGSVETLKQKIRDYIQELEAK